MADVKISGLPASSVPLAGTEVLPIVQGGQTRQVSVANLTDGRNVTVGAGTVSAPAITTTGDTNTGIFFPAADTIAFTEGGAESMRITSAGNVGIGVTAPSDVLHVRGAAQRFDKSDGSNVGQIRLHTTTDSYASIWALGQPSGSTNFAVQYWNGSAWADRISIDSAGSVGIGSILINGFYGSSFVTTKGLIAYSTSDTSANTAPKGLVIRNDDTTTSNLSQIAFATLNTQGTAVATASIYSINDARGTGFNTGSLGFGTVGGSGIISERMRIHASGGVSIGDTTDPGAGALRITDNLVIGTSGKGIDFSATAGTGTSELLADYEEGTWTATASGELAAPTTPVTVTSTYTKVGRLVTVTCNFSGADLTGASGTLQVTGLPYTPAETSFGTAFTNMSGVADISYIPSGQSRILFIIATSGIAESVNATTNRTIWATASYIV